MRKVGYGLALLLVLAGCGGGSSASSSESGASESASSGGEEGASFAQISVDEVASALETQEGAIAIFDANSRETYDEHHVPTATWVDYDALSAEQLPEDRGTQLVFYCANEQCSASHVAAESAMEMGYQNVAVMGAGIQGWIAAGKPVEGAGGASQPTE